MTRRPVGLLPAAGFGTRLGALEQSKELIEVEPACGRGPLPVIEHALSAMADSGLDRAHVVIRDGKWDIPARLRTGTELDLAITYTVVEKTPSAVHTLDLALRSLRNERIALAFPDILVEPSTALATITRELDTRSADAVLALFPWDKPAKSDMVEIDTGGNIRDIVIKDPDCSLEMTWSLAVWRPSFTRFLADFVERASEHDHGLGRELYVGDVLKSAARAGLTIRGIPFLTGTTLDIGTPDDLARARSSSAETEEASERRSAAGVTPVT